MGSPFLYYAEDRLSLAELSAARLDGDVVELGDAYIPADAVETPSLRAGSLRGILGTTLAATHLSAAWIHGAIPQPPTRHTVQRAVERRLHHVMGRRLVYRDVAIAGEDLLLLGGVLVTAGVRTLADLARVDDASHREAMLSLAADRPGLAREAVRWLDDHRPLPRCRPAMAALSALAADEVRTR
ncbi:hypothetical protein GCM10022200_04150 [Microbacterium awajiense]|uniref:AbiEi antitoxin C-terminal domain-containing protein n=1 Tax=Microbacterium awajiense TaxID=415214 RepID=A0ABP7A4W3_9MICO